MSLHNLVAVDATLADISTASTAYAPAPVSGRLHTAYSCLQSAISGSNATWSLTINSVAVPGTGTVTASGSAAGDVDEVAYQGAPGFSKIDPPMVNKGDTIGFVSGGQSDDTAPVNFTAVIRT